MKLLLAFISLALLTVVYTQTCPRCTPLCVNGDGSAKVCGDDGCGGSCGTCPQGNYCCRGTCNCQPNCAGRACGDDGCGFESCGRCSTGQTCNNGICSGTSSRDCANRVCGMDTFGGSCGSCPAGQRCRGGSCECYYSCEERNCGNAMQDEGSNTALCPVRSCGTCPTGFSCSSEGMCNSLVPCDVTVTVVDCVTRAPVTSSSSVAISSAELSYSFTLNVASGQSAIWTTPGLGSFEFMTTATGYLVGTETRVLDVTTTSVQLCLTPSTILVDVRDRATDQSIGVSASISYSGFASGQFNWNGVTTWTHAGYGTYTLVATPSSIYSQGSVTVTLDASTSMIIIYVDTNSVLVDVRDRATDQSIGVSASISYSGFASGQFNWNGVTTWAHAGFGTYTLVATPSSIYSSGSVTVTLDASTSMIIIYVDTNSVLVDVRDRATDQSIGVSALVSFSGANSGSFNWNGLFEWNHPGLGQYTLVAQPSSMYGQGSESVNLDGSVSLIIIYVDTNTVLVDVRDRATDVTIGVSATINFSGFASGSFQWNGVTTWTHMGFGQYTLTAIPASVYTEGTETVNLDASVSLIIIYVEVAIFCGDGICNGDENFDFCEPDCVALFLEFENADGSGPVNAMRVNFFLSNPRDLNQATGPNRNGAVAISSRETGSASNTVYQGTYSYNQIVYFEAIVTGFINFYWAADTGNIDPGLGTYRLRVHSSQVLGATNFNYRTVNTWKPIDATPEPFGPTDLNLHLFHPQGALDINNPSLLVGGFSVGRAVADSKQSGGPATMDISPGTNNLVAIWNSKPPRSRAIAPSQAGRYLVNSGSYIVIYGKTSNAATGKQLGQIVLDQLFLDNPSRQNDQVSDLWYAGDMFVNNPGQDQPTITAVGTLKAGTVTSQLDLVFDCEAYAYCAQFVVPYSDTGR